MGWRAVAQLGSALDWGSRGRRFKSCQPDSSSLLDRGSSQSESTDLTPYLTPYTARGRRLCHSSSRTRHAIVRSSSGLSQRGFTGGGEHPSCLTYSRGPRTPTRPRSTGGGCMRFTTRTGAWNRCSFRAGSPCISPQRLAFTPSGASDPSGCGC